MNADGNQPGILRATRRRVRRYRITGGLVLLLGLGAAGWVYCQGMRVADLADDPSMIGYDKAQSRQMGMLYGKQGLLIEDWSNHLKQPDTQAFLIAAGSLAIAAGCFYFARLLANEDNLR